VRHSVHRGKHQRSHRPQRKPSHGAEGLGNGTPKASRSYGMWRSYLPFQTIRGPWGNVMNSHGGVWEKSSSRKRLRLYCHFETVRNR